MSEEVKREARRFEPPPWEKDAFEALARKKAEDQEALEALAAAEAEAAAVVDTVETLGAEAPTVTPTEDRPEADEAAAGVDAGAAAQPAAASPVVAAPAVGEHQVQAMLLDLSMEETTDTGRITLVARIASVITAIAGGGMVFAGLSAMQGLDPAKRTAITAMGSGALSVFGLCFVGMAVWVWIRSNRVKGSH